MEQVNVVADAPAPVKEKKQRSEKQVAALQKGQAALKAYREAKKKDAAKAVAAPAPVAAAPTPAPAATSSFTWSEEIEDRLVGKIMNKMSETKKPRTRKPKAEVVAETPSNTEPAKPKEKKVKVAKQKEEAPVQTQAPAPTPAPAVKKTGNKMLDKLNGLM